MRLEDIMRTLENEEKKGPYDIVEKSTILIGKVEKLIRSEREYSYKDFFLIQDHMESCWMFMYMYPWMICSMITLETGACKVAPACKPLFDYMCMWSLLQHRIVNAIKAKRTRNLEEQALLDSKTKDWTEFLRENLIMGTRDNEPNVCATMTQKELYDRLVYVYTTWYRHALTDDMFAYCGELIHCLMYRSVVAEEKPSQTHIDGFTGIDSLFIFRSDQAHIQRQPRMSEEAASKLRLLTKNESTRTRLCMQGRPFVTQYVYNANRGYIDERDRRKVTRTYSPEFVNRILCIAAPIHMLRILRNKTPGVHNQEEELERERKLNTSCRHKKIRALRMVIPKVGESGASDADRKYDVWLWPGVCKDGARVDSILMEQSVWSWAMKLCITSDMKAEEVHVLSKKLHAGPGMLQWYMLCFPGSRIDRDNDISFAISTCTLGGISKYHTLDASLIRYKDIPNCKNKVQKDAAVIVKFENYTMEYCDGFSFTKNALYETISLSKIARTLIIGSKVHTQGPFVLQMGKHYGVFWKGVMIHCGGICSSIYTWCLIVRVKQNEKFVDVTNTTHAVANLDKVMYRWLYLCGALKDRFRLLVQKTIEEEDITSGFTNNQTIESTAVHDHQTGLLSSSDTGRVDKRIKKAKLRTLVL